MGSNRRPSRLNWGLFQRREIWLPTFRGWCLVLLIGAGSIFVAIREADPFLAVTDPVSGGVLVVEGWLPDYAFDTVAVEFARNRYDKLYVTGGPFERGAFPSGQTNYADSGAAIARSKGLPATAVQAVPAFRVDKDRTYSSAVALKDWLIEHRIAPKTYHVMTLGVHARRTRLLFEDGLGAGAIVGITAIEDLSYDPNQWWSSSAGVRAVIGETIAYVYARLFFSHPR